MKEYIEPTVELDDETRNKLCEALGCTQDDLNQLPPRRLIRAVTKLELPDRPKMRLQHEYESLCNDQGEFPADAQANTLKKLREIRASAKHALKELAGIPVGNTIMPVNARVEGPTAGLNANNTGWTPLGPGNIGGRTRAIVIDPNDTTRIYTAGVGGGVWLSTDSGNSWTPTDDLMANLAVCSLIMDPTNNNVLYAGTGEGFSNVDAIRGNGIFVTTDGANSWNQIASTSANPDFFYVNSLAISSDGQTLLAGTTTGLFRSTDAGQSWNSALNEAISNLAFDPTNSNNAIAGGLSNGRAYYSTDGGASWTEATRATNNGGRVQVCYASADTSTVYASVQANPSQIWRSTDGGQTYTSRNAISSGGGAANFLGAQGWYDNAIWAGDPTNVNLVIVGGIDLWRSTDGGNTLTPISTWWDDQSAHADHHLIVSDPGYNGTSNQRAYFGNDGGIYTTSDVTTVGNNANAPYTNGWVNLNNGYEVTQFYYGDCHIGTNTVMGGTQDNGTLRYTPTQGLNGWNSVWGGDGGATASDPSDSLVWYGEYVYLQIFRDTSGGTNATFPDDYICGRYWDPVNGWSWKPAPFTIPDAQNSAALFIAPFELDRNDPNRILGGGRQLWRTNDAKTPNTNNSGPSWASIKADIGSRISAIAIADGDSDNVLVGHSNGNVYRSTDATANNPNWTRLDTNGIGANRQCLGLAINPDDHDLIYAAFGGFQADNLWRSDDGGASWTDISAGLPDAPIRAVTMHPQRSAWVYLATQVGVFASEDGGNTWSPTNEGPANVACRDFTWLGCKLIVVTHGRGMFEIDLHIANAFPDPVLSYVGSEDYSVGSNDFTRYKLSVTNFADYPDSLFRASPDLPPCGNNTNASRTWVDIYNADNNQRLYGFCGFDTADDLTKLWFALPKGTTPPGNVYVVLRDRRCSSNYTSNSVAIPSGGTVTPTCQLNSVLVTLRWWGWGRRNSIDMRGKVTGCDTGARVDIMGPRGSNERVIRGAGTVDSNGNFRAYYRGRNAVPGEWRAIVFNADGSECCRSDYMNANVRWTLF